jgi:hypothetical protein
MEDTNKAGSFSMKQKQTKLQNQAGYAENPTSDEPVIAGTSSAQAREILNRRPPENEYLFGDSVDYTDNRHGSFLSILLEIPIRLFNIFR